MGLIYPSAASAPFPFYNPGGQYDPGSFSVDDPNTWSAAKCAQMMSMLLKFQELFTSNTLAIPVVNKSGSTIPKYTPIVLRYYSVADSAWAITASQGCQMGAAEEVNGFIFTDLLDGAVGVASNTGTVHLDTSAYSAVGFPTYLDNGGGFTENNQASPTNFVQVLGFCTVKDSDPLVGTLQVFVFPISLYGRNEIEDGAINGNKLDTGAVDLTSNKVSGVLPIANGGTNNGSPTTNGVPYFNGTSLQYVTGGNTPNQILHSTSGNPQFGALQLDGSDDLNGQLGTANGGTGANLSGYTNALIVTNGASPAVFQTNQPTNHAVLVGTGGGSPPIQTVGPGNSGTVLHGQGSGADPSFSPVDLAGDVSGLLPFANNGQDLHNGIVSAVNNTIALVAITTPNDGNNHYYTASGFVLINSVAATTVAIQITFTDHTSVSRTKVFFPQGAVSSALGTTDYFTLPPMTVYAEANTTITVSAVVTGATIDYDAGAVIERKS